MARVTSLRAGKFKKKLVSPEALLIEAPLIENLFKPFLELYSQDGLTHSELTTCYIILILSIRHPRDWPGSKQTDSLGTGSLDKKVSDLPFHFHPKVIQRIQNLTLGDIMGSFALKSTPRSVNRALIEWSNGKYKLELMFRIPSSLEVLKEQKDGKRCVTILKEERHISKYILGERDSLSFTLHDLIHADHFYHDNHCYEGQIGFYNLLNKCIMDGDFKELEENENFMEEFDYLISDMNAYAIHLMKCLKSAMIFYHPSKENYFNHWVRKITNSEEVQIALLKLNTKKYIAEKDDKIILSILLNQTYGI